ncbi:hypothetical protein QQS21_012947, partial [Conoideocrella luteorostrata]
LARVVEPDVEPDEEQPNPSREDGLQLASLGIELASQVKDELKSERQVVTLEQEHGIISRKEAKKRHRDISQRYLSEGDKLWRLQKKKMRLDDPGVIRVLDPSSAGVSECLLALYQKSDGLGKQRHQEQRPKNWRKDAISYYNGICPNDNQRIWCHISGKWHAPKDIKGAHIVPFFMDIESISDILFGERKESIQRAGNALLLHYQIKSWFDKCLLVIVPVDATEHPIARWQTDVISPDIEKQYFTATLQGKHLHGKELTFLGNKRPVSRFLYFHFIMALVRVKDLKRDNWEDIWARYYTQRPFPTPGPYMRRSILFALATHFETTDMKILDSWIKDNGFDTPLQLTKDEATEVARRVHVEVEATAAAAEVIDETLPEDRCESSSDQDSESGEEQDAESEEEQDSNAHYR